MIAAWLFWLSALLLVYIYAGYPVLVHLRARRRRAERPPVPPEAGATSDHTFDVLIASHREGAALRRKLEQVWTAGVSCGLQRCVAVLDGPDEEALEACGKWTPFGGSLIVLDVASGEFFGELPDYGVLLIPTAIRRGKPSALNWGLPFCRADWTVLMDVRQELDPGCLKALTKHFPDPATHVVSGNLQFRPGTSRTARQVGAYWRYEQWIRRNESALGCVPGATGACMAVRRSFLDPVPADLILDDVWIPMHACRTGGACRFESRAVILDDPSTRAREEALRKRRTIGGMIQLSMRTPRWWLPGGHPFWMSYGSHKILRLYGPFLLGLVLVTNLWLLPDPLYILLCILQGLFYFLAGLAPAVRPVPVVGSLAGLARAFLMMNGAVLPAWFDWLRGRVKADWRRAYIQEEEEDAPTPAY